MKILKIEIPKWKMENRESTRQGMGTHVCAFAAHLK